MRLCLGLNLGVRCAFPSNIKYGRKTIPRNGTGHSTTKSSSNCLVLSEFLVSTDFGVCLLVELWQDARNGQCD